MATREPGPPISAEEQVDRAISALRTQRRRHIEALAEIDEALWHLGAEAQGDRSAEESQFRDALERVNRLYGQTLQRLA